MGLTACGFRTCVMVAHVSNCGLLTYSLHACRLSRPLNGPCSLGFGFALYLS